VILTQASNGKPLLLAGQKSGHVYALDPDADGALLWQQRIGEGTSNGGIHWGMANAGNQLFIPLADPERPARPDYTPMPGLYAVNVDDGSLRWAQHAERGCDFDPTQRPLVGLSATASGAPRNLVDEYRCSYYHGHSAAATATNDIVFSARLNGQIGAHRQSDGALLWRAETARPIRASNGISGHGGAIDVGGQRVVGGWLYVSSGYSMFGQLPGNLLLAYKLPAAE
jgi:polyvinyl alcohol dehydrogenase (cytochrome)